VAVALQVAVAQIHPTNPDLREAMRLHRIGCAD
jgi:hypothetical protein